MALLGFGRNIPGDAAVAADGGPGQADGRDTAFAVSVVERAKRVADAVVVMTHTGVEKSVCPTANDRDFMHALLDAGASVVVGNHPHVLQAIVTRDDKLVMYSNGNFVFIPRPISNAAPGCCQSDCSRDGKVLGHDFTPAHIDSLGRPQILEGAEREERWPISPRGSPETGFVSLLMRALDSYVGRSPSSVTRCMMRRWPV